MFRSNSKIKIEHINFLFDDGGLGDNICRLTAIKYVEENLPHVICHVWVPDYYLEFAKHFFKKNRHKVIIKPFSKGILEYNDKLPGKKTSCLQHTNMGTHLIDNAFHVLVDKTVDIKYKNYLQLNLSKIDISKFILPKKYVIVTTGFTAEVREMKSDTVNEIVNYVTSKGYVPVFLGNYVAKVGINNISDIKGNFSSDINYAKGLDLINKTTLLECGKIISGAKAIVGLDNGLLHIAGCTQVPIVAGFTTVKPEHRLPYRNNELGWNCYSVTPEQSLECRFCQSNWEFVFDNDFRKCFYKQNKLDTVIQCVDKLTSDKYIIQLEKIL